jgi:hypothetical protein
MMTKKNFEVMADLFNANGTDEATILDFCDYAKEDNPRFDREQFLTAAMASHRLVAAGNVTRLDRLIGKG